MTTVGVKYDSGKLHMDLISPEAIQALARTATYGIDGKPASPEFPGKSDPYPVRNWEQGMDWGRVFAALQRHSWAWWSGEDLDQESGFPHIEHALWCAAALATYRLRHIGTDTRAKVPNGAEMPTASARSAESQVVVDKELTGREEADIVLRHLGWTVDFGHVVEMAKTVLHTETVEYEIHVAFEGGDTARSTLVLAPRVPGTATHEEVRDAVTNLHRFMDSINHEMYMMTNICPSFGDETVKETKG